jgi:hypothetical protein
MRTDLTPTPAAPKPRGRPVRLPDADVRRLLDAGYCLRTARRLAREQREHLEERPDDDGDIARRGAVKGCDALLAALRLHHPGRDRDAPPITTTDGSTEKVSP